MNAFKMRLGIRTAAWLLFAPIVAFGQGSLTPPGPPGPTMKTLVQVEPRTLISSVPYIITNSGSYYLTGDLTGTSFVNGITISANNISLDLEGFSIVGCSNGITAGGVGISGVAIRNGTVRQSVGSGINLGNVANCAIEHVRASGNGGNGIGAGVGSLIELCIASGNAGAGITADTGSTVFSCVVQSNSADGIAVSSRCRVNENTCDANGSGTAYAGIHVTGDGGRFEANNLSANNSSGIKVDGTNNLVIKNSACSNTGTDYNIVSGNSYGQILAGLGSGFTNSNPWANFSCIAPPPTCMTDADCATNQYCSGGACTPKKASGLACAASDECLSGNCQFGFCQTNAVVSCTDGIKNGAETDVDCGGGTCPQCANGKNCIHSTDCVSGVCSGGVCVAASSCTDGIKDGAETDVDCGGGTCPKCVNGKNCFVASDCVSGVCSGNICVAASCTDTIKNGNETDVDCGGGTCPACPNGKQCIGNGDCISGVCSGGVCVAGSSCSDGIKDGAETDIDCGGGTCSKCANGKTCVAGSDCVGGSCCGGVCHDLTSDPINCGNCGTVCSGNNIAVPTCSGGTCNGACNSGFADCDGNKQSNGCEVSFNNNVLNCGGCGVVCSGSNITPSCSGGICNGACAPGYADCNGNKLTDGCEVNISSDPNNCGGCGISCSSSNMATRTCSSNSCSGVCAAGFADCDGNRQSNGCEINLTNDKNNCGSCGHVCPGVQTCSGSTCH